MRCTSPRIVGFKADGKTISWSPRTHNKEFAQFQLPCGKCIACRLEYARQWAIRCVHEASMHPDNCFITLTYDEQNLKSPKLQYRDFQLFMKKLRFSNPNRQIGVFVTGEYGDLRKRPHWHAIIFNWSPPDPEFKYTTDRGDTSFSSKTLTKLWGHGTAEYGEVTFHSAGYCARYAAKKLGHGNDNSHEYDPISKKSSKHAIGKTWLEKNYKDVFNHGKLIIKIDGQYIESTIPRYYEKWLKKHKPTLWQRYVTESKQRKIEVASIRSIELERTVRIQNEIRRVDQGYFYKPQITQNESRKIILEQKFKQLQKFLKL